jgi:hypothetical protein
MENKPKNPIGRPSKYGECLPKAQEYLMGAWRTVGNVVPSRAGLACFLGVNRDTVQEWAKEYEEFSGIVKGIDTMQEMELSDRGLDGTFNSAITKLLLSKHGYSDKVETDHKSSDGSMSTLDVTKLPTEVIKQILAARDASK